MADKSVSNSTVTCNATMFMNFLRYSMPASVSIDIYRQTSTEWKLALEIIYMTVASLQFTMSILFNLLMLGTVLQKKIRITSCGIYLLVFTLASLIGMSIFYLRIIVTLYFNDELEKHNVMHCRLSSMILNCAQILCLWIGAFISVERVLIECFHFSIYRSRMCAIISSLLLLLLTIASCITWFLGTQYAIHPIIPTMYLCKMRQLQSTWILVDEILTSMYIHVVIPWMLHIISTICIVTHITRRKIILTDTKRSQWTIIMYQQLRKHKDFFIPPIVIIICTMPHFLLDRLSSSTIEPCLEYNTDVHLRLHIAFDFLYFLPQTFGFLFYIYPSNVYMHRYREAWTMNCTKFRHRSAQCCATIKLMNTSIDNVNNSSNITTE